MMDMALTLLIRILYHLYTTLLMIKMSRRRVMGFSLYIIDQIGNMKG